MEVKSCNNIVLVSILLDNTHLKDYMECNCTTISANVGIVLYGCIVGTNN